MGEKITPTRFGSFVETRLVDAAARARGTARRGKPKSEGKQTTKQAPRKAVKASSTSSSSKSTRKPQSEAARAASLANLALARAARS